MKKNKFLLFIAVAGLLSLGVSGANCQSVSAAELKSLDEEVIQTESRVQKAPISTPKKLVEIPGGVAISDSASFFSFFDGGAGNRNKSAYLTADIDFGGIEIGLRMADSFSGIFEGNYFTLSNYVATSELFNITSATSEIRNVNFRTTLKKGDSAVVCYYNNGSITNVNVEAYIKTTISHGSGLSRVGAGPFVNCHVDLLFEGEGTNSTYINAVSFEQGTNVTNCSYYVSAETLHFNAPAGITKRSEPLDWDAPLPPRVDVTAGYVDTIYVEIEPNETTVTAVVSNADDKEVVWDYSILEGEAFGSVEVDEGGVATITAIKKGKVSFKFKATVDETDYLSSVVEINILNNEDDYVIPANAFEIETADQFKQYFNSAGTNTNKNGVLMNDIDLGGFGFTVGMAGNFVAIFEGQGYTIKNFKANRLFENILSSGEVRNLKLEFSTSITGSGAVAYNNGGLIKNVKTQITILENAHTYGGMSLIGAGTFKDCHADFIVKATNAHALYPILQNDAGKNLVNCSWTLNGAADSVMAVGTNPNKTRDLAREGALGFSLWIMEYVGGDISTAECSEKWGLALSKWKVMIDDAKDQVRTESEFESAWSRLQAWALANNVVDIDEAAAAASADGNLSKKNTFSAGLLIGAIGITTMMSYYFLSKKKKHN